MFRRGKHLRSFIMAFLPFILTIHLSACESFPKKSKPESTDHTAAAKEKVTLKFLTWDPSPEIFKPILAKFESEHPNIKVELTVITSLDYQQMLPISLSMHEDYDVVGVQPNLAGQIDPYLEDLNPLFSKYVGLEWKSMFKPADINRVQNEKGQYTAMPVGDSASMILYYNNELLHKLGLKEPETYEDLKAIVNAVETKMPEVIPIAVGGKEGWILDEIVLTIASQKSDLFNKIRYKQGGRWDSPEYIEAVTKFKQMLDDRIIQNDSAETDHYRALDLFTSGQAVLYIAGSWEASILSSKYREENKIALTDVGLTALPSMYPYSKPAVRAFLDYSLGISKDSKHKEEATELLKFFTLGEGADAFGNLFYVIPSKIGFKPDLTGLQNETAMRSYQKLKDLINYATVDRNNLSAFSDYVGKKLQRIMLAHADIHETVKEIQTEFDTGKYLK